MNFFVNPHKILNLNQSTGKYVNHKGRGRSFTSAEELAREQKDMQNKKNAKARVSPPVSMVISNY